MGETGAGVQAGRDRVCKSTDVNLFYSESDSSNLLYFNLSVLYSLSHLPEREKEEGVQAYTLYDCGASHKFVSPDFIQKLPNGKLKARHRGNMQLTTAGKVETLPLKEVRLNLDIGGLAYQGWFIIYPLAKYDIILGKDWMEEIPHHVNHKKNRLWLGGDGDGNRFKYTIDRLKKDQGRNTQLLAAAAKREPVQKENSYTVGELLAMELGAEMVDEVVIGEIVDEATFKADCAAIWMECMTTEGTPEDGGVTELSEFERRV